MLALEQNLTTLEKNYCALGALKTHIGHLESAAGIASVIKVLLAMKNNCIPKNRHFSELNPFIEITDSPFFILNETIPWKDKEYARKAGISSFGFGGTNAHIIIEAHQTEQGLPHANNQYPQLITFSAKTDDALHIKMKELFSWLKRQHPLPAIELIGFTLNVGRVQFSKTGYYISHFYRKSLSHSGKNCIGTINRKFNYCHKK